MSTSTDRQLFRQLVTAIADKARQTLPDANGRVDKAVALVLQGDVELLPDGTARVYSQSNGVTGYHLVNGVCDCADFERAPSQWCKHRIAHGILTRVQARLPQAEDQAPEDQPAATGAGAGAVLGVDPKYVVHIQGTPFVRFSGLLDLAHRRGLQELRVVWTHNSEDLSLAHAVAVFPHGTFEECGDASPASVTRKVALHFRRVACTRAAARALRLALGIDVCSVEESADEAV